MAGKRSERAAYRGAFILLYAFLAVLVAVWFAIYAVFMGRGSVG